MDSGSIAVFFPVTERLQSSTVHMSSLAEIGLSEKSKVSFETCEIFLCTQA